MKAYRHIAAFGVLVVIVGAIGAWAQIGSGGTILGCVGPSGLIRGVDDATRSCRSGDVALSLYTKPGADSLFLTRLGTAADADKLDGFDSSEFALAAHNHDGRYYTKAESDSRYVMNGALSLDRMDNYFVAEGEVTLTQPDFDIASFNQVIAEITLHNPVSSPDAETFEPFVLVSAHPVPLGLAGPEYNGDVSWKLLVRNQQVGLTRQVQYVLQFFLETQPQQQGGNDPAPAGSRVKMRYRVLFLR